MWVKSASTIAEIVKFVPCLLLYCAKQETYTDFCYHKISFIPK